MRPKSDEASSNKYHYDVKELNTKGVRKAGDLGSINEERMQKQKAKMSVINSHDETLINFYLYKE